MIMSPSMTMARKIMGHRSFWVAPGTSLLAGTMRNSETMVTWWIRSLVGSRSASTMAFGANRQQKEGAVGGGNRKEVVSYWGVQPRKLMKEDGSEWKWKSFTVRMHKKNQSHFKF